MMKKYLLGLSVVICGTLTLIAKTVDPVEAVAPVGVVPVGANQGSNKAIRELRSRVASLEAAVQQLQTAVFDSNGQVQQKKTYTCYINTTFDGTFLGKGESEVEAKAKALRACNQKTKNSATCRNTKVECGS